MIGKFSLTMLVAVGKRCQNKLTPFEYSSSTVFFSELLSLVFYFYFYTILVHFLIPY